MTILFVAYILVPPVTEFLTAAGGYQPAGYEPKDQARERWLDARGQLVGLPRVTGQTLVNVGFVLLVVVVWLALVPPGGARRR